MKQQKKLLEQIISEHHKHYFFKELTFSVMDLPYNNGSLDFADNLVYLDGTAIVYQMKERTVLESTSKAEEKWFKKNVLYKAVKQIKDSTRLIYERTELEFKNQRDHSIKISKYGIHTLHKIILYKAHNLLPQHCLKTKYYISGTEGFIHIFSEQEYKRVLYAVPLIMEFSEYLIFRESLIRKWDLTVNFQGICESAILGQYFSKPFSAKPSNDYYEAYRDHIEHQEIDIQEWDISRILGRMSARGDGSLNYYPTFNEIAKLTRIELKEFKKRWVISMDEARKNIVALPHYLLISRTNCGFIFIPVTQEHKASLKDLLVNYTIWFKYHYKLSKCVGVAFFAEDNDEFDSPLLYIEEPWKYDEETEKNILKLKLDEHFNCKF
jgi:hypothetical protein